MKAHYKTPYEKVVEDDYVERYLCNHVTDFIRRGRYLVLAACLNVGLCSNTVNKINHKLPPVSEVREKYVTRELEPVTHMHFENAKQRVQVFKALHARIDPFIMDVIEEAQTQVLMAMSSLKLSEKTIDKVVAELDEATKAYGLFKYDKQSDYVLAHSLQQCGVDVEPISKKEI